VDVDDRGMKTDAIFYEIFKAIPNIFFELIGQSNINSNAYEFTAPALKQTSLRLDGVFLNRQEFSNQPLYFVETQFYKDEEFYDRLFTGIFLYFSQYRPPNADWFAVVIYDRRSNEATLPPRYRALVEPDLRRFYLNETEEATEETLGVKIVRLVVASQQKTGELAKQLVNRAREELTDPLIQQKVIEFIEVVVVYKFPNMSREEIEAMLNINLLKETRVYQEAKQEGKLEGRLEKEVELVTKLLRKGLSIQEVADLLELDVAEVRKAARE
jgi:predicted transposase/invertase (TIGR01784 family)